MTSAEIRIGPGPEPRPGPARPATRAHVVSDDAEALAVARRFAAAIAPGAAERDRLRIAPLAEVEAFSQSGLWSLNVPKSEGGPGLSYVTLSRMFAIVAAADPSIAQIAQNHLSLIDLIRFDPDPAKRRFLYDAALFGLRFGNAISERGTKHVLDFRTRLIPAPGGFVVRGEKFYATGALHAHFVPVQAIGEDGLGRLAFVDRDAPGLSVFDDWSGFGQRTTASGTLRLDDVFVPAHRVLETWRAYERPSVHGPVAQIIHVAIDVGIARGAIDATVDFVRTRARPWVDSGVESAASDPYVIRDVGALTIRLHVAEALLDRAARAIDAGLRDETAETVAQASIAVAEAKAVATEIALEAGSKLLELSGTRAALLEDGLDRWWRDARVHTLHDPVRWKLRAIGAWALNREAPPRHAWS